MLVYLISGCNQGRDQDWSVDIQPLATAVQKWNQKREQSCSFKVIMRLKAFGEIVLPCVVETNDAMYPLDSVSWTLLMKVNLACRIDWDKDGRVLRATSVMLAHGMPPPYWWVHLKQHTCIEMHLALGLLLLQKPLSFIKVTESYICYVFKELQATNACSTCPVPCITCVHASRSSFVLTQDKSTSCELLLRPLCRASTGPFRGT